MASALLFRFQYRVKCFQKLSTKTSPVDLKTDCEGLLDLSGSSETLITIWMKRYFVCSTITFFFKSLPNCFLFPVQVATNYIFFPCSIQSFISYKGDHHISSLNRKQTRSLRNRLNMFFIVKPVLFMSPIVITLHLQIGKRKCKLREYIYELWEYINNISLIIL